MKTEVSIALKRSDGMVLDDQGIILETGLTDAMPSIGDLNGDGVLDMAVGSRNGEMRIYYGDMGEYSVCLMLTKPLIQVKVGVRLV